MGGGGEEPGWLDRIGKAGGGGGKVAHSAAFWEKVRDMKEEELEEEKRKERLSGARKIQSSAAFWEQMTENNGCKLEGGQLEVGDNKWEEQGKKWEEKGKKWEGQGKKVKRWEVRSGILEERRKHWAEGEHQTIDHEIFLLELPLIDILAFPLLSVVLVEDDCLVFIRTGDPFRPELAMKKWEPKREAR